MSSGQAAAYPNFISFGYQSCAACHYNPYGNGPLTDYGRALSATEVSDRLFANRKTTEEQLGEKSEFFGKPAGPKWLRPSIDYRGLYLSRNLGEDNVKDEYMTMDLNATVVAKFLARDKLTFVGQIAYSPKPRALKDSDMQEYRSREHYVGYRFNKELGVYAGLMDKVFGIRVPDHIAFSRTVTGLAQNDQTHGALFHYATTAFEIGVQPFVGNMVQDAELRQKGVTSQAEVTLGEFARAGASVLSSSSDYLQTLMYAAHTRVGVGKGHSIMAEVGEVARTPVASDVTTRSRYVFTQTHVRARRGLWGLLTLEALKPDVDVEAQIYRIGPGLQFFPFQRLELRADAYNTHRQAKGAPATESWDLAAQFHVWL